MVAQSSRNGQLHLHSLGIILYLLLPGQGKTAHVIQEQFLVPVSVNPAQHMGYLYPVQEFMEMTFAPHNPNLFLDTLLVRVQVQAQYLNPAAVTPDNIQHGLKGGGFAGPVFPYQPHDGSLWK